MRRLAQALAFLLILGSVCPAEVATAAPAPYIQTTKTIMVDGVATGAAQLSTVSTTGLPFGTQAWAASVGDWFDLGPATGTPQALVVVATPDGRQWVRRGQINRQYLAATYWSWNPATGSDENVGWGMTEAAADSHPLASLHELNRRLTGWNEDNTAAGLTAIALSIHQMADCQALSCYAILTNLREHNGQKYIRYRGTLTPVDGSASNLTIATYQAAVPASNTEREITITGLGTTPTYVGKIIQTVDGTKTAVVTRQNSSDHLSIGQVRDNSGGILDGNSSISDFTVGDHLTVYDAVKLPGWPFPSHGVPFPLLAQVRLDIGSSGIYPLSDLGAPTNGAGLLECILGSGVLNTVEYFLDGGSLFIAASVIYATHANEIADGLVQFASSAVLINGDGPLIENESVTIGDELLFTPMQGGGGGVGIRNIGVARSSVTVIDQGSIGSFGMNNSTIDLLNTHDGVPGDFYGSDSNTGSKSRWYGSGNTSLMLVLPKGTRSKFPLSGITVTTSVAHPINMAGTGIGDTFHNYDWASIPIVDTATLSALLDSNPATSGGGF